MESHSSRTRWLHSTECFQYAAFYDARTSANASVRYVSIARRELSATKNLDGAGEWETLTLKDYAQTDDDGHNVISLGISSKTGSIHLGFDQHDNDLNYRVSKPGVATNPHNTTWSSAIFGPVVNVLPGLEGLDLPAHFENVTYPRFLSIPSPTEGSPSANPEADLLLEMRVGRAGLGDDWLYAYVPDEEGESGNWTLIGKYLEGVNNNAYINGLDFDLSRTLHTSWTYRDYINDTGQDVAVEAGPNGPENNHDLAYASSADLGNTWINSWGQIVSVLAEGANKSMGALEGPIDPDSPGITVFSIPKYGGILNQEAQTIDSAGRFHVLNRENTTGIEQWYHYWRTPSPQAFWVRSPLPLNIREDPNNVTGTPTVIGKRGKLVAVSSNSKFNDTALGEEETTYLLAILPSNAPNSTALSILAATSKTPALSAASTSYLAQFTDWSVVWSVANGSSPGTSAAEPLFDRYRLAQDGVLSLFLVSGVSGEDAMQSSAGSGNITVVDLDLSGLFN
ncbi:hypothetical protein SCHPADRAFT_941609 [Schizopora paradoxa]|uniref:Dockerin type 1 n=1 Tax=Schizopora paradoxa TaxID=27342 RepID=A0A0H2S4Y8_9AGAM|nr:hypothetical protein SCHPADRAFT_941609 [Schizopora paradoxa]